MKLQVTQGLLTAVALLFMADAAIAQTSTAQTLRVAFVDSRVIMDRAPGRRVFSRAPGARSRLRLMAERRVKAKR